MRTVSTRVLLTVGLAIALVLAGVVSLYASTSPDGLNRVALDLGFAGSEQDSAAANGPLAGYVVTGLGDARWSAGLAGVLGCLVVLGCSSLLFLVSRRAPRAVPIRDE